MADIGIVLDSFNQPVKEALESAARLAFRQVEMPAVTGEVAPEQLSQTGRRHLGRYVAGLGLQLSALGADLGGGRFADSAAVEQRLDRTRQIMELAAQLRVPVVSTHLGRFDADALKRGHLPEAVRHLAEIADRTGTLLAFETGGAEPKLLADLLEGVDCRSLGVCYDPASLVIDGVDAEAGISPLADRILLARARDAVAGVGDRPGHETPLGQGQVDWTRYLADLDQAGYRSATFLRRVGSEHPGEEIAHARDYLKRFIL